MGDAEAILDDAGAVLLSLTSRSAAVVYKDPDDDDVTLDAIVGNVGTNTQDVDGRRNQRNVRSVEFSTATLTSAVTKAATVTVEGEDWAIDEIHHVGRSMVRLRLVRAVPLEVSRAGLRG